MLPAADQAPWEKTAPKSLADLLAIQQDFRVGAKPSFDSDNGVDFTADEGPEQMDTEEL